MKNVVKIFIATAVMGVMTVSAFAQKAGPQGGAPGAPGAGQRGGQGGPGGGMRRMDLDATVLTSLKLTPAQTTKIKALKDARNKKAAELFKSMAPAGGAGAGKGAKAGGPPAGGPGKGGPGGGMSGMREKMKPIQDAYLAGVKATLTPAQFTAYEKGVKEAREKMRAQFGKGPGGPGGPGAAAGGKGKGKGGTPPPTP